MKNISLLYYGDEGRAVLMDKGSSNKIAEMMFRDICKWQPSHLFSLVNKILWESGGNLISMVEWTWGDTNRMLPKGMFRNFIALRK